MADGIASEVVKCFLVKYGKQWDGREAQGIVGRTPLEAAKVIVDNYELPCTATELLLEISPMFSEQ